TPCHAPDPLLEALGMGTATKTSDSEISNPRLLLQAELSRRIERNPRYSMRRFSQALGVSHTVLSLVLSGKRPLSKKAAAKVSDFLGFDPAQRESLLANRKSMGPGPAGRTDYQQ